MHILLLALFPFFSHAGAFEDGQKAFQGIKEIHDLAIEPIEFKYQAELAKIRDQIREREIAKGECTTFECAQEINKQIAVLNSQAAQVDRARRDEIIRAELPFELDTRELALNVYIATLKEQLSANPDIRFLLDRGNTACGIYMQKDGSKNRSLPFPHVCLQTNLDFKQGSKFVRLSLAVGTVRKHFAWHGQFQPVPSALGLNEMERLLNTPGRMEKFTKPEHLERFANTHLSYYSPDGIMSYMLGGTSDIGLAVISREEQ